MCDKPHYEDLEGRVDKLETRLSVVETSITDMRRECSTGFADIKEELGRIYGERSKWGEWARENIGQALKWAGIIILTACGITQASNIVKTIYEIYSKGGV